MVECNLQQQCSPQMGTPPKVFSLWEKGPGVLPQGYRKELGGPCG